VELVPNGFGTTAYAYRYFIQASVRKACALFSGLDVTDVNNLRQRGKQARSHSPHALPAELTDGSQLLPELCRYGADTDVAVRSSAQLKTYLMPVLPVSRKPTQR